MATVILNPPNRKLFIAELYAFISTDEHGNEGLCGYLQPSTNIWMAMVGADLERVELLIPMAKTLANVHGHTIRLVKFGTRQELQIIEPRKH